MTDTGFLYKIATPAYIIDEARLVLNLEILADVAERSGCKILLAQKAFSAYALYPLIGKYLAGTASSGLFEARLSHEEMRKENHVFAAAYPEEDMEELLEICDHVVFNSFSQWKKFKPAALRAKTANPEKTFGIRVNPEHSTQSRTIYDPCAPGSRLGVRLCEFCEDGLDGIEGLHFHTLCEQNSDALAHTLAAFEEKFGRYVSRMKWVNFGGGHHITRADYDRDLLVSTVIRFREKYGVEVYLEPGEAVALDAGYLAAKVLDIVKNDIEIAILDASAACHMPDVLEMPYSPRIFGASGCSLPRDKNIPNSFRLAGPTCLAGDIIGDYTFETPLAVGDRILFLDMAIYSMVKNNTFNGIPLPSIYLLKPDGNIQLIKKFSYADFKGRLS